MAQNEDQSGNFSLDEIDIDLEFDKDAPSWDKLIEKIIEGNVIPIIGPNILVDDSIKPHDFIIKVIERKLGLTSNPKTFSELAFDTKFKAQYNKRDSLYQLVNTVMRQKTFTPSRLLQRILSIRQFPFVITTSFTPVVEHAMKKIWGDDLRVMRFNNNPQENDDIKNMEKDLGTPTVYYMFGKVGEGCNRYVLTDTDMLNFCTSWLSHNVRERPKNLCNAIKDKYLLMLGNNYSDWLFRFIWFSMRKQDDMGNGMLMYEEPMDDELIHFLTRVDTFIQKDPSVVVDKIIARLNEKIQENEKNKFDRPRDNMDVFISYSRSDLNVATQLYEALTRRGKKVWFDKKELTYGGNFIEEIYSAIRSARYFVPIISDNIMKEVREKHVYRNEWKKAVEVAESMGVTFIIPVAQKDFDFYGAEANIPEKIRQHNALFFSDESDIEEVADRITAILNKD